MAAKTAARRIKGLVGGKSIVMGFSLKAETKNPQMSAGSTVTTSGRNGSVQDMRGDRREQPGEKSQDKH
ncbi:MAG: hypothetical protein ACKOAX_05390, partial [Candidatus Kapaibacterium sp.]